MMMPVIVCASLSASLGGLSSSAHPKSRIDRSPSLPTSSSATSSWHHDDHNDDNYDSDHSDHSDHNNDSDNDSDNWFRGPFYLAGCHDISEFSSSLLITRLKGQRSLGLL